MHLNPEFTQHSDLPDMMNTSGKDYFAHEIRTPLTVIIAQAQLLARMQNTGQLSNEALTQSLSRMDRAARRIAVLCDELGESSKSKPG